MARRPHVPRHGFVHVLGRCTYRVHTTVFMVSRLILLQPLSGLIIAAFKPASPPILQTPDAVWEGYAATNIDFSFTAPSLLEVFTYFTTVHESKFRVFTLAAMGSRPRESAGHEEKTRRCMSYCLSFIGLSANAVFRDSSMEAQCLTKRLETTLPPKAFRCSPCMAGKLT